MTNTTVLPTELHEFIKKMMPWAHGHQIKAITKFVLAIIEKQTGNQAELSRGHGNKEAAAKQLSRLIHNPRLRPADFAAWLCRQALEQAPRAGKVRLTIDWTTEDDQHLLVISLVVGRRALPIYWRAYSQQSLKGHETVRVGRHQTRFQIDLCVCQAPSHQTHGGSWISRR